MKYEIRKVDEVKGIIQITVTDERWYQKADGEFKPSSSWISDQYPKGIQFYKWLADKGWDEAEAEKEEKGNKGTKVHHAIEAIEKGMEIKIDDKFENSQGIKEELTPDEYYCVITFAEWYHEMKPEIIATEVSGINDLFGGTIDLVCKINNEIWIIDFKTSQNIWSSHELQVSSYLRLLPYIEETKNINITKVKLGILQVGYMKNKTKHWKLTEIEDKYDLFLHAYAIWENEVRNKQPSQREYPLTIKL